MADDQQYLVRELRRANRLLALLLTKDLKQSEAISELSRAGFQPRDIADVLGTTSNTVSVALSVMKSKKGRAKNGRKGARR